MIRSMTGFGKGQAVGPQGAMIVEIRTLNHKYLDIGIRLPEHLGIFEDRVRDYVKNKIRRGRINLAASWESKEETTSTFALNIALARKYYQEMLKLKKALGLKDDLGISQLIALPEVITYKQKKEQAEQLWPLLSKALIEAEEKLTWMRQAEGKRLARDLQKRAKQIGCYLNSIERQLPQVIARYRKNLLLKVRALVGNKEPGRDRIAEEVALFVRNSDVSEELTRIRSHLTGFKSALRNQKEAGKELDFIAQELFREANTIGAKASCFRISRWVIKVKSQIEKIREQLQNVE